VLTFVLSLSHSLIKTIGNETRIRFQPLGNSTTKILGQKHLAFLNRGTEIYTSPTLPGNAKSVERMQV
jgi:hypothetical protein